MLNLLIPTFSKQRIDSCLRNLSTTSFRTNIKTKKQFPRNSTTWRCFWIILWKTLKTKKTEKLWCFYVIWSNSLLTTLPAMRSITNCKTQKRKHFFSFFISRNILYKKKKHSKKSTKRKENEGDTNNNSPKKRQQMKDSN